MSRDNTGNHIYEIAECAFPLTRNADMGRLPPLLRQSLDIRATGKGIDGLSIGNELCVAVLRFLGLAANTVCNGGCNDGDAGEGCCKACKYVPHSPAWCARYKQVE